MLAAKKTATEELIAQIEALPRLSDEIKVVPDLAIGEYTAQGDVNFWKLEELPKNVELIKYPQRKLAPGISKGSRHCIKMEDMEYIQQYHILPRDDWSDPNPLLGPVLVAAECFTVEHPEHKHQLFPPGIWAVTYQRQHTKGQEEQIQRALD